MLTFKLKTLAGLFIAGLFIGFFSSLLFTGCDSATEQSTVTVVPAKDLRIQVDAKDAAYLKKIAGLRQLNAELQDELKATQSQLTTAKQKAKQKETVVKKMIAPAGYPAKKLLEKVSHTRADSIAHCDSLAHVVNDYLVINAEKDSLYEAAINIRDSVIAVKDTTISSSIAQVKDIKQSFDLAVSQQASLEKENKKLQRKLKRKKFGNTLKSIGLMIVTGVATNYINNH